MKLKIEQAKWITEHLKKINMSDREIMDGKNGIMCRESYGFRDPVVKNVVDKFVKRSDVGYAKYGQTLHEERTSRIKGLAELTGTPIEKCIDAAYNEIKDRTGKMNNGTFKKD